MNWDSVKEAVPKPGYLGAFVDHAPPAPQVVAGGPTGVLVQGPLTPDMPTQAADAAVATPLRPWLTPAERDSLAEASQRAAAAPTGTAVAWQAKDGAGNVTATGMATPATDAFRAEHGELCRGMQQSADKNGDTHLSRAILCRIDLGASAHFWRLTDTLD
jgi:surface antigen